MTGAPIADAGLWEGDGLAGVEKEVEEGVRGGVGCGGSDRGEEDDAFVWLPACSVAMMSARDGREELSDARQVGGGDGRHGLLEPESKDLGVEGPAREASIRSKDGDARGRRSDAASVAMMLRRSRGGLRGTEEKSEARKETWAAVVAYPDEVSGVEFQGCSRRGGGDPIGVKDGVKGEGG